MGSVLVLDTSVLIDHERGSAAAAEYVAPLLRRNVAAIHPVTQAELLFGAQDRSHLARVRTMIGAFRLIAVRNADFTVAIELLEKHTLKQRVGWPDCLIAATCLRLAAPLVTLNTSDFKAFRGLNVIRPY